MRSHCPPFISHSPFTSKLSLPYWSLPSLSGGICQRAGFSGCVPWVRLSVSGSYQRTTADCGFGGGWKKIKHTLSCEACEVANIDWANRTFLGLRSYRTINRFQIAVLVRRLGQIVPSLATSLKKVTFTLATWKVSFCWVWTRISL